MENEVMNFANLVSNVQNINTVAGSFAKNAVNQLLTIRNWLIGYYIVEYEQRGSDRAKYGENLLSELNKRVNIKGVNQTLLKNSRRFYMLYPQVREYSKTILLKSPTVSDKLQKVIDVDFLSKNSTVSHQFVTDAKELVGKLSFSHIVEIMTIDDAFERYFYEVECIKCCWSVRELRRQIATNLFFRAGISKKPELLFSKDVSVSEESALSVKDPFVLEFLGLEGKDAVTESDLEQGIMDNLQKFLIELGHGFCFEARQKRIIIDDRYYFADLVFYNRYLHCNVIVELKNDEFKHEYLGQLNAYVGYYKENEMRVGDNPPVGILLCTRKGTKMVEYALSGMDNNLFVSTYMLQLPDKRTLEQFLMEQLKGLRM